MSHDFDHETLSSKLAEEQFNRHTTELSFEF